MRLIAAAAAALLLAVPALAETNVGVTAAVNQSANGTVGSNVRTISLGDSVIYNERIQTGGEGLVQILLADGTTFMVGPNSDLVIDSFVYDPNAGTAQVTASFTKGVLRFIGGQTSKTEGGVTLNTPVGTMGIRGAMVDVVLDPPSGTPQHIDMLFGNEVTLEQGQQLLGRLYAAGYSLVLGEGGTFDVMKTPPGWGSQIQAALAGKPGTKGGAPKGPTDDEVGNSEFAENNQPNDPPGLSESELKALLEAAATYDEIRPYLGQPTIHSGFAAGQLGAAGFGEAGALPGFVPYDEDSDAPIYAEVAFAPNGDPIAIAMVLTTLDCDNCQLFVYDSSAGEVTVTPPIVGQPPITIDVTSASIREATEQDRQNLEIECACDFIRWGFWSLEAEGTVDEEPVAISVDNANWVTGDLTTAGQLEDLALSTNVEASYSGDAIGRVTNPYGQDGPSYTATGDLSMSWNFADRDGVIHIEHFDSENLGDGGGIHLMGDLDAPEQGNGFFGRLTDGPFGDTVGAAQGAFVNDGPDAAQGVIGNFGFTLGPEYSASGIFFGQQDTPH